MNVTDAVKQGQGTAVMLCRLVSDHLDYSLGSLLQKCGFVRAERSPCLVLPLKTQSRAFQSRLMQQLLRNLSLGLRSG